MGDLPPRQRRDFEERLARAENQLTPQKKNPLGTILGTDTSSSFGLALRVASDMIAGIALGVGIGYGLSHWWGHRALFLIVFTLLGFCAGMRNVWRVVNIPAYHSSGTEKDRRNQRGQRIDD